MEEEKVVETVETKEVKKESKGFSIASMVLGIISLVLLCIWYISLPCSILAIIFSIVGMKKGGKGMAIAGLVTGIVAICLYVLIFVVAFAGAASMFDAFTTYNGIIAQ